ncbi:hypothetical protein [Deinococcus cavernae]|nr:hypothetical protein [Deinococcus cavernae]
MTAAEVAQIARLYREGRTVTQIRRLVGRPPHLIRLALHQAQAGQQ